MAIRVSRSVSVISGLESCNKTKTQEKGPVAEGFFFDKSPVSVKEKRNQATRLF